MINISVYKQYGIYAIINIISGMSYIGQTHNNFGDRWDCHKALLRNNKHHNPLLQNDWNKYGEGKFKFIILYNCIHNESQEELDSLEEKYIKEYMENNNAYNLSKNKYDMRSFVTDEMTKRTGELNRQRILGTKLSDSTKKKDMTLKLSKYENAGVKEYWIVDPEKEKVTTYIEGEPMMAYIYNFEDEIPVYIYDGKLKIKVRA